MPIHEETNDSLSGDTVGQVGGPVYGGDVRQQIEGSRAVEQPVDSPHEDVQHSQVEDDRHGGVVDVQGPGEDVECHGDNDTGVRQHIPSHGSDDDGGLHQSPIIDRPRRQRRPNVRYSDHEYDLSSVAAPKERFQLLGLYIVKKSPNT